MLRLRVGGETRVEIGGRRINQERDRTRGIAAEFVLGFVAAGTRATRRE